MNPSKLPEKSNIRFPTILFAVLLLIITNYWVSSTWNGFSLNALFINAIFVTFLMSLLNPILRRIRNRLALHPSELFLIYMMLAIATGAAGHDTLEMLTQTIGHPFWFGSPENEWPDLFYKNLPRWLMVDDKNVLEGFYTYGENFYEPKVFYTWLRPLLFWTAFLIVLYFCMVCINILLRKQWIEREKLAFPIAQPPLGLMSPLHSSLKNKFFWYGFGGAALLSLMNGLHRLYPIFPGPTYGKFDLGILFTEKPWNAIDAVYVEFLPFIMGLAFFIPISLSFSIWFFYWFWKMEMVLGSVIGVHYLPGFPGYWSQGMGAVIFMFVMFLFWARQHLWQVIQIVFRGSLDEVPIKSEDGFTRVNHEDSGQYRLALIGLLLGFAFLVIFCSYAGMAPWVGILFIGGFYVVSTVVTRVRVELGPPTHDFPFTIMPLITNILGVKRIDASSLTQFAVFKFVDYGHRSNPMPHIMESFYLAEKLRVRQTGLVLIGMILAIVLGTISGFLGNLQRCYTSVGQTWVGDWAFPELANQLRYHSGGTNILYIAYFLVGGAITAGLAIMNRFFVWWPFHPLGYLLGGEWMLRYLWFSIFIAWLVKFIILRFGGLSAHRKAVPIFVGITIGDGTMLALWNIYGNIFNKWTLDAVYW